MDQQNQQQPVQQPVQPAPAKPKFDLVEIIAEDGNRFFGFVPRNALFDGSVMSGRRYRVEYLTKSHLVIGLTPLSPLPKRVSGQARLQRLAPLMNQYK